MTGVAFVDSAAHPDAAPHYRWAQLEVDRSNAQQSNWRLYENVVEVPHMDLYTLLGEMDNRVNTGQDVLICTHGTAKSLHLPVQSGGRYIDTQVATTLNKIARGQMKEDIYGHKHGAAGWLGFETWDMKNLGDVLARVQKKNIGHLAIRACNVGNNDGLLDAIKTMFNAKSISAPKLRDAYVSCEPAWARNTKDFESIIRSKGKGATVFNINKVGYRVAIGSKEFKDKNGHSKFDFVMLGESPQALEFFVRTKMMSLRSWVPGQRLFIHALFINNFMYFPMEAYFLSNINYLVKADPLWYIK